MSWNKNALSYLIWLLNTFIASAVFIAAVLMFCTEAELPFCWGIGIAIFCGVIAAAVVFKLSRLAPAFEAFVEKNRSMLTLLEGLLVSAFLFAGIFFRVQGIASAKLSSEYFDAAMVASGQGIPRIVHGASYLYVGMLRGIFILVGNQFVTGIWIQIVLQMTALMILFFVLRRLAGHLAALMTFGFFMCAPFMIQNALVLSPWMLYFLIFMLGVVLMVIGYERKPEPAVFLLKGVMAAFICYLDISGLLLFGVGIAVILCSRREEAEKGRKTASALFCLAGLAGGLAVFFFLDALLSGKSFVRVAGAWFALYRPEGFRLPVTFAAAKPEPEVWILAVVLVCGIFSFWRDRQKERISPWVLAIYAVVPAGCFGIFEDESQGFFSLYLLLTGLAGVGLAQCFQAEKDAELSEETAAGKSLVDDLVIEELADGDTVEKRVEEISDENREQGSEQETLRQEKALKEEFRQENAKKVQFLENPLPLPRKHVKRVMDYPLRSGPEDDFDYPVGESEDFDI